MADSFHSTPEVFIRFTCANCECETTLHGHSKIPADELCPPCHFFGLDWKEDPGLVKLVDAMQNKNRQ